MPGPQVATRLTCFALISAVERDLRRECRELAALTQRVEILPSDVRQRAAARWARDRKERGEETSAGDIELLDYTDFADLAKVLNSLKSQFSLLKRFDVSRVAPRLETLSPVRNRVCHSRPLEADDFSSLFDFATDLASSAGPLHWSEVGTTLDAVRDNPRSVLKLVIPEFWAVDAPTVQHNLPLPEFDDTGFIGRHEDRKNVSHYLLSPHPIVTIVGEGGAGKTALALRCLYDLLEQGKSQPYDALLRPAYHSDSFA
jgi:LuxR family transcriptional regulator, glucitol operon activator